MPHRRGLIAMTDQSANEQRQITELEHRFIEACLKNDTQVLDSILADDFIFTDPNGVNLTKQEWLADLTSGDFRFEAVKIEALQVSVRADVATVQASLSVRAQSKKAGYNGRYSAMDIYERRGGRWEMILSSANQMTA
jgi:ketosteroid isomerase-like protein